MKVCLAQINTTPGDFEGNVASILRGIDIAAEAGCDAVIFPELTIAGYLSQDLIYDAGYVDRNLDELQRICEYSARYPQLHVVLGYIDRNPTSGKPFLNMAGVILGGDLVLRYIKQLLPFYDVFDEGRYFEPGTEPGVITIAGQRVGIAICEDLWNDKGSDDYNYQDNPLATYRDLGVDIIFSLNSSPYVHGKGKTRLQAIAPGASNMTVVYVNQRGGQDELVFDGQSFVVRGGDLVALCQDTQVDSFDVVDLEQAPALVPRVASHLDKVADVELYDLLVLCLRDYVVKSGFTQLVLASSGGVDSAVVCQLACDAVGPANVHAIRLPSMYSSDHSRDDAKALHENLGCWDYEVPVDHQAVVEFLNQRFSGHSDPGNLVRQKMSTDTYASVADENIQARLRDLYVMHFSNAFGAMPLSTGNKTESACGYYTHFDMNFSFAPIKDLYKFQVVDIAKSHPDIPPNIWRKPPSAELAHGQTDEKSLLPYAVLDPIVQAHVEDYVSTFTNFRVWAQNHIANQAGITSDLSFFAEWLGGDSAESDFQRILSVIGRMEYKRRQTCPGIKVSRVAFGIGRRIPIVEKWS